MRFSNAFFLAIIAGVFLPGCGQSATTAVPKNPTTSPAPPGSLLARIHWLGKARLAAETNAGPFMSIWNQPESARLETQTLDKLSTSPWRLFPRAATTNTAAARWFRPLLDDLVREESYLEVRQATNAAELVLAIRLSNERAAAWETNLAAALESLTGIRPAPAPANPRGWALRKHHVPNLIELARAGDWTLVGAAHERNGLLDEFVARIQKDRSPFAAPATNFWLEARVALPQMASAWSSNRTLAGNFPAIALTITGDGTNVRTRGELTFPETLPIALKPWTIPTNLIQEPLVSFVAARSVAPLLRKTKVLSSLEPSMPDQVYLWGRPGNLFQTFFVLPVENATNALKTVGASMINWIHASWSTNNGMISIATNAEIIVWQSVPFAIPTLGASTNGGQFLYGGLALLVSRTNRTMPPELVKHLVEGTNVVFFNWELSGQQLVHWRYADDIMRMAFDERGPLLQGDLASLGWIARNLTNLASCVTEIRLVDTNRLTFARKSTVGLSALELELLAVYLERPNFPDGLDALLITNQLPVDPKRRFQRNRAAAASRAQATNSPVVPPAPPR